MKVDKSKWKKLQLKDIGKVISGATPRTDNPANWEGGSLNWVTPAELNGSKYYGETIKKITSEAALHSNVTLMPAGTVLLTSRAPIGKVAITTVPMYCNQGFKNIVCNEAIIYNEYLYYYLISCNEELNRRGTGATFKEISKKVVESFPVLLPPLEEQEGIVAELDRIQGMIDGYKAQIADLDALAQSIFLDTFGDPVTNPKGWPIKALGDVCFKITDGIHASPKFTSEGIPFIFVSNVVNYEITYDVQKHIDEETYSELWKSTPVEPGDIIYTSVGSYGNPAIVRDERKFMFQRHIALLKIDHTILHSEFVKWFLISPAGKNQADEKAIGVAQKTLNLKAIKSFELPLPPLALQELFAARVKAIEELKVKIREQVADCEMLMAERMQAYFS